MTRTRYELQEAVVEQSYDTSVLINKLACLLEQPPSGNAKLDALGRRRAEAMARYFGICNKADRINSIGLELS